MSNPCEPLTHNQIDQLDSYLLSDQVSEEALDYIAMHGYLCALSVSPVITDENQWLSDILAQDATQQTIDQNMLTLIRQEYQYINTCLESDADIDLPCDLTLELDQEGDCLLEYWAQGFMELVFTHEDAWFCDNEDLVTELLLPILLAANLGEHEELTDLRKQHKLCQQLCEQIPELVQDLFLLFRVPADKGSAKKANKPH